MRNIYKIGSFYVIGLLFVATSVAAQVPAPPAKPCIDLAYPPAATSREAPTRRDMESVKVRIHSEDHPLTRSFEFDRQNALQGTYSPFGSAVRHRWRLFRTSYDLFDGAGTLCGRAHTRLLSASSLFSWAVKMDVYDPDGASIGHISGEFFTSSAARFGIYDAEGSRLAVAYLSQGGTVCTITAANNDQQRLARLQRVGQQFDIDGAEEVELQYPWDLIVFDSMRLDPRLLSAFSAFLVDRQNAFVSR